MKETYKTTRSSTRYCQYIQLGAEFKKEDT